jgi:hypothetical protein
MRGTALADLPPARQADVLAALGAVETADAPVPRSAFRALADGTLRSTLEDLLEAAGRVLLEVGDGFVSGYDDRVAERLVDHGVGVLPPDDRAVLTLVLLHTVAIPRARGTIPSGPIGPSPNLSSPTGSRTASCPTGRSTPGSGGCVMRASFGPGSVHPSHRARSSRD